MRVYSISDSELSSASGRGPASFRAMFEALLNEDTSSC
jgi:hypothetical protein